jgi:DNA-binding GntR family transcriptional regulator
MKATLSDEIATALRNELMGGQWVAGSALPSVDDLRERFAAGEYAVRRALKQLRDEGFITLRQSRTAGSVPV